MSKKEALVLSTENTSEKLNEASNACLRITQKLNNYIQGNGNSKKLKKKCDKFSKKIENAVLEKEK